MFEERCIEREKEREQVKTPENYTFVITENGVMFTENILPSAAGHLAYFIAFYLLK